MLDLKITGGTVLDGTGAAPLRTDVGVKGDTITAIGDLSAAEAGRAIALPADSSAIVVPGFIDAHSHSDTFLLIEPGACSKVSQGITTEIVGNCGASAAPISDFSQLPSDWADKRYPGTWSTVAEYRELLEKARPAVNVGLLIGHNTLRRRVVGYDDRPASASELAEMERLLDKALAEGGMGLSTGLIYAPGMFASNEELVALARVAARHDGIYTSHMRSEGAELLESIGETLEIGVKTGLRVEISHLKVAGRGNWAKVDEALQLIRSVRDSGMQVAADRYPYIAGATELDVVFPGWAAAGGRAAVLKRLADPAQRSRLHDELLASRDEADWEGVVIGSTTHPDNTRYRGATLPEAARELGLGVIDAILYFAETDELRTGAFFAGMSEQNMRRILAEPYVMVGTDASLRAPTGPLSKDHPHPRAYGSFPRFLRMVLDEGFLSLPEAVRKITSLPSQHFGLGDRGVIAEGKRADLVVFDPDTICDTATYGAPHSCSEGVRYLIVNGVTTIADGAVTGDRAGVFV